jgi:hypothetical protein
MIPQDCGDGLSHFGIVYLKIINKNLMEIYTSCSEFVPLWKLKYGQNLELGQIGKLLLPTPCNSFAC